MLVGSRGRGDVYRDQAIGRLETAWRHRIVTNVLRFRQDSALNVPNVRGGALLVLDAADMAGGVIRVDDLMVRPVLDGGDTAQAVTGDAADLATCVLDAANVARGVAGCLLYPSDAAHDLTRVLCCATQSLSSNIKIRQQTLHSQYSSRHHQTH